MKYHVPTKMLVIVLRNLMRFFTNKSFYQGFFAVKRRAVFILGAMWWALVRGWRRDCVVGGMETRFQCRKAHNPYAKCEAFHIAPRLFFMFLFLITFTIRQQCRISLGLFHWASNMPFRAFLLNRLNLCELFLKNLWERVGWLYSLKKWALIGFLMD